MHALIVDDDPLVGLTLRHFLEKVDPTATSTQAADGVRALRALNQGGYDLVFLDLELPEVDGPGVLQSVGAGLPVIVVSAHTEFAARSYEFDVVDYLIKPLEFSRFHRAWQKFLARAHQPVSTTRDTVTVRDGNKLVQVRLDRLLYLEADSNYTRLVSPDRSLLVLASLKRFMEILPPRFLRVHRSYAVNHAHVEQVDGAAIKIGGHRIPIGDSYREQVLKSFAPVN